MYKSKDDENITRTMQKRSGIYQDRVEGKLPMDRVKGHYAQTRLAQDAKTKAKISASQALKDAEAKPTVAGTAIVKGTTYKKYSDGRYTMTKDGNTTSSSKTAYVGAKKNSRSDENKKDIQKNAIEKINKSGEKSGKKMQKKAQSKGGNIEVASKQPTLREL